jgi:sodium-dependent dicarboxylate transporter 2/3/5
MSITLSILKEINVDPQSRFGAALLIGVPWAAGIGGIATPVGSPPNVYALGLITSTFGQGVGFLQWMAIGFPTAILATITMFAVIKIVLRPEFDQIRLSPTFARDQLQKLGPMKPAEFISASMFLVALFFWMLPDLLTLSLGSQNPAVQWVRSHLSISIVAILGAMILFIIPLNRREQRFAMTWDQAVRSIDWGVLALTACAIAMGNALASNTVGLGNFFASALASVSAAGLPVFILMPVSVILLILLTNFISNFASLALVASVALPLVRNPELGINPLAFAVTLGMATSFAFAFPSSAPPVAIAFASGQIKLQTLFKSGILLAILSMLVAIFVTYSLANIVLPPPQ